MSGARGASPSDLLAHGRDSRHGDDSLLQAAPVRLAADQMLELADLVADRLAERLRGDALPTSAPRLVDAGAVAEAIGMSAAWVRERGAELGGQRLGDGPRPRWRFDLEQALAAWATLSTGERSLTRDPAPQAGSRRRRSTRTGTDVPLLPVRGSGEVRRAA